MQANTPKNDNGQRQRPLQKSMFLPEFQPQPLIQQRPQPLENIHYNPMKRSSMPVLESMHQTNLSPNYHTHNVSYSQPFPPPPMPLQFEMRAQSQHELLLPQGTSNVSSMKALNVMRPESTNQLDFRAFTKFDKSLGFQAKPALIPSGDGLESQQQQLINLIVQQIKDKHLPNLMKAVKKQLSDEMNSLRTDLSNVKAEMKLQTEKQEFFNNEIRSQTGNIINFNTNNINNINRAKKEEGDFREIQKQMTVLQRKYGQIQVKLSENLTSLYNQFEKISQRLEKESKEKSIKVSQVKSSLSPIMLEYRQTFVVKRNDVLSRSSGEEEILLGSCNYYIDRTGYLLDAQGKYLTDMRGHQIKLQQKHLKLLEQHKLLHK